MVKLICFRECLLQYSVQNLLCCSSVSHLFCMLMSGKTCPSYSFRSDSVVVGILLTWLQPKSLCSAVERGFYEVKQWGGICISLTACDKSV